MAETYATYKVWDGCSAPSNLESNGRLRGQRVSTISIDRDELLSVANEMEDYALTCDHYDMSVKTMSLMRYAERIRKAIGEEVTTTKEE